MTPSMNPTLRNRAELALGKLEEQAKGMVAARLHVPVDNAFELLRRRARSRSQHIDDVARQVLDGSLPARQLLDLPQLKDLTLLSGKPLQTVPQGLSRLP